MEKPIIEIGYNKGEIDFGISGLILSLNFTQMQELRAMIIVAIGTAEDMWRKRQELPTVTETKKHK